MKRRGMSGPGNGFGVLLSCHGVDGGLVCWCLCKGVMEGLSHPVFHLGTPIHPGVVGYARHQCLYNHTACHCAYAQLSASAHACYVAGPTYSAQASPNFLHHPIMCTKTWASCSRMPFEVKPKGNPWVAVCCSNASPA